MTDQDRDAILAALGRVERKVDVLSARLDAMDQDGLLDKAQVALLLGKNRKTVERYAREGLLRGKVKGDDGLARWPKAEVMALVRSIQGSGQVAC